MRFIPIIKTFVRHIGLEPTRLASPDPKSGAATNYANAAEIGCKITKNI